MARNDRGMRLFSFRLRVDAGATANPFAIYKPLTQRVSKIDDWFAGVGSTDVNSIMRLTKTVVQLPQQSIGYS